MRDGRTIADNRGKKYVPSYYPSSSLGNLGMPFYRLRRSHFSTPSYRRRAPDRWSSAPIRSHCPSYCYPPVRYLIGISDGSILENKAIEMRTCSCVRPGRRITSAVYGCAGVFEVRICARTILRFAIKVVIYFWHIRKPDMKEIRYLNRLWERTRGNRRQ